ncbi:MAG: carboxypeptidase-like regulatory domain-containing protein [Ignavibacteriae bacterium]|nr:carboxypeptidase-like regulatory domain-containing protein [Ignavibacteriota bacterium]MCB9220539.1 carboxypeptidase-like regulatory domain-containing protein [Ignavibacteria bacterium]
MKTTLLLLIALLTLNIASAEVITGRIVDSKTKESVVSASVRLLGTSKGTYANREGIFKLPGVNKGDKLKFTAIGYQSETVVISNETNLDIKLVPESVKMSEATVTDEIAVEEIIKRAVANKEANQKKIKTVEQSLFSKVKVELGGALYEFENPLPGTEDKELERDLWENIIAETYSKSYKDFEKRISKDVIIKRRNTANFKPEYNLISLSSFVNFYADEIGINNTRFTSPLSKDALDEYEFKLISRELYDDKFIYVIEFKSISNVYPGFVGTMSILEESYELTYIKAKPTSDDLIEFISNIEFEEKFEKMNSDYWYPTLLNTTGQLKVELISGMFDFTATASAMTVVEDLKINQPLPDSIYNNPERRVIAAPDADSAASEFWANSSLINTTDKEREIYTKTDSLAKEFAALDSVREGSFNFDYAPYLRLNRVDGFTFGISPMLEISRYFNPEFFGAYAITSENWYFGAKAKSRILDYLQADIGFERNTYPLSVNNNSDILLSTVTSLFVRDYYDWYLADRVDAGLNFRYDNLKVMGSYKNELISNIPNNNPKLFSQYKWRDNRVIDEGRYEQYGIAAAYNNGGNVEHSRLEYHIRAEYQMGKNLTTNENYNYLFGEVGTAIPIINTGFEPGNIYATIKTGISNDMPKHLLYRMNTQIVVFKIRDRFLSTDYTKFGGTEFLEIHTGLDFSDLLWRAVGLPKYRSRGLGLELNYSAGYYKQDEYNLYSGTNEKFYNEVGFNITKIPSFISPLIQLEAGFRWGIGELGNGNFGFGINVSSPIFQ